MPSFVWQYFKKEGEKARCKKCSDILKCAGSSTSGLISHLKSRHGIVGPEDPAAKKQHDIAAYHEKVVRLVAEEGFTFKNMAAKSASIIREGFHRIYPQWKLPRKSSEIAKITRDYFQSCNQQVVSEIQKLVEANVVFSVTLDEWSSVAFKRYANFNLHYRLQSEPKSFNLGIIRIWKIARAAKMFYKKYKKVLENYGLKESNIAGVTGNDSKIMLNFSRLIESPYFICSITTLHRGIGDALYKEDLVPNIVDEIETESDDEYYLDESDTEEDETEDGEFHAEELTATIKKMRKIVVHIKQSPAQKKIFLQNANNELNLVMDEPTYWKSLHKTVFRFFELLPAITKTIENEPSLKWTDADTLILKELVEALQLSKDALTLLSKTGITLIESERIIKSLLETLHALSNDSQLANKLHDSIAQKLNDQRNDEYTALTMSLAKSNLLEIFPHLPQENLNALGMSLFNRLFAIESDVKIESRTMEELQASEVSNLLEALLTIQATSVPPEQSFFTYNSFVTVSQSFLDSLDDEDDEVDVDDFIDDETLSKIVFLKYHFKRNP